MVLPLKANARDLQIVSEALGIVGVLRNAALGELLGRLDDMRSSSGWVEAALLPRGSERTRAFRSLCRDYGLSGHDAVRVCHGHWRDSQWMGDRIGGRIATALGPEVWLEVSEYLYGRSRRPAFKPSSSRSVVWNNDNKSGLLLRGGAVQWRVATDRKCLSMALDMSSVSRPRREWLNQALKDGRLRRVGIKRESVRGRERLFALVCLAGDPYRSEEYLANVDCCTTDLVGLDLGPTWLAMVSRDEAQELPIASEERIADDAKLRARARRRARAAMRSRRNSNTHTRRKNGQSLKGVRQPQRSKNGLRREQLSADDKRRDRINRRQDRSRAVRQVMQQSPHVALENLDYRSWQKSRFGRRMLITAPGDFVSRLAREAELMGGSVSLVDPYKARASQTCLCGAHTGKKGLSERTHRCSACGLRAPRDLVSAALVRELALADQQTWNEELALASGTKNAVAEMIQRPRHTSSFRQTAPGKRGVKQGTERASARSTALSCAKPKPDPVDDSQSSAHVPTCERPSTSARESRKAAAGKRRPTDEPVRASSRVLLGKQSL